MILPSKNVLLKEHLRNLTGKWEVARKDDVDLKEEAINEKIKASIRWSEKGKEWEIGFVARAIIRRKNIRRGNECNFRINPASPPARSTLE